MNLYVTHAVAADADRITDLVNRAYRPASGFEGWTHESALVGGSRVSHDHVLAAIRTRTVLAGYLEQALIGCVQIEMNGTVASIGMLAVDPSLQAGGLGSVMLQRAEAFAAQQHHAEVAVLTVIAAREALVAFYLRRGYRQTGESLQYPIGAGSGTPSKDAMTLIKLEKRLN